MHIKFHPPKTALSDLTKGSSKGRSELQQKHIDQLQEEPNRGCKKFDSKAIKIETFIDRFLRFERERW